MSLRCPDCQTSLVRAQGAKVPAYCCPSSGSTGTTMAALRAVVSAPHLNDLWQAGLYQSALGSRACPSCLQPMRLLQQGPITLDGCLSCQFLWFDVEELQALPEIPPEDLAAIQRVQERAADAELRSAEQRHGLESQPLLDWIRLIWG